MLFLGLPRPWGSGNPALHSEAALNHDQRSGVFAADALARLSQRPVQGAHHPRQRPDLNERFWYKISSGWAALRTTDGGWPGAKMLSTTAQSFASVPNGCASKARAPKCGIIRRARGRSSRSRRMPAIVAIELVGNYRSGSRSTRATTPALLLALSAQARDVVGSLSIGVNTPHVE
jgi:hypothetical protein